MTHLEDVAKRLVEYDGELQSLTDRTDNLEALLQSADVVLQGHTDELDKLRQDWVTVSNEVGDLANRVGAVETAGVATAATTAAVKTGKQGGKSQRAAAAAAASVGSAVGGGLAPAAASGDSPAGDPTRNEVRARVHDLAVASGHVADSGNAPRPFTGSRVPTEAAAGESVYLDQLPWSVVGSVLVDGATVKFVQTGKRVDFDVPSGTMPGVVQVVVVVPNVGDFQFPLTIRQ